MNNLMEMLPFLIPLAIAQFTLMGLSLYHVLTHTRYKRGNRVMWIVITVLINFIGPILYFVFGKEDA